MHIEQPLSLANRVTACQKATEVFAIANIYTSSTDLMFIAHCLGDITVFEPHRPFTDDSHEIKGTAQIYYAIYVMGPLQEHISGFRYVN
jgi:hypothetical protein